MRVILTVFALTGMLLAGLFIIAGLPFFLLYLGLSPAVSFITGLLWMIVLFIVMIKFSQAIEATLTWLMPLVAILGWALLWVFLIRVLPEIAARFGSHPLP